MNKYSKSDVSSITFGGKVINHHLDNYAYSDGIATIGAVKNNKKIIESMTDDTAIIADYIGDHKIGEMEVHADFSADYLKELVGTAVDIKVSEIEN